MNIENNQLLSALEHLRSALGLLDLAGAPAHIGAHVDFAIHELQASGEQLPIPSPSSNQIDTNAAPQ
jgi:hypothetical protein